MEGGWLVQIEMPNAVRVGLARQWIYFILFFPSDKLGDNASALHEFEDNASALPEFGKGFGSPGIWLEKPLEILNIASKLQSEFPRQRMTLHLLSNRLRIKLTTNEFYNHG